MINLNKDVNIWNVSNDFIAELREVVSSMMNVREFGGRAPFIARAQTEELAPEIRAMCTLRLCLLMQIEMFTSRYSQLLHM